MDHYRHFEVAALATIAEMRARSLRTVEAVFGTLVVVCAAVAAVVHVAGAALGVSTEAQEPIAFAFLVLAVADLGLLFACRAWLMRGVDY